MANRPKREELGVQPNEELIITGTVAFSRIYSKVEGEELQRNLAQNQYAERNPHYTITLNNPEFSPADSPLAQYYKNRIYMYTKDNKTPRLTLISKTKFGINAFQETEDGKGVQINLKGDLAEGQPVKVHTRAFGGDAGKNMSDSFDAVLLPAGNIKYFGGASTSLSAFGLTLDTERQEQIDQEDNTQMANAQPELSAESILGENSDAAYTPASETQETAFNVPNEQQFNNQTFNNQPQQQFGQGQPFQQSTVNQTPFPNQGNQGQTEQQQFGNPFNG